MKRSAPVLVVLLFSAIAVSAQPGSKAGMLKHIVTVTFKAGATAQQIDSVDASFKNLAVKLPMVVAYEWGVATGDKDTTHIKHVYITTFKNAQDEAAYGASSLHQKHIKLGVDFIEGVQATDFIVKP